MNVADFVLQRLAAWDVHRVFGYPGDGINGLMGAFGRGDHGLRFVQVRHEEMAAFMACAHAKFTGEVGVCMATSGPGAIHLLNGLYDAKLDHMPVVAIVGQAATASLGAAYQQEVDLTSLFKDVASEYVIQVASVEGVRTAVDRAVRIARSTRSVTAVILPKDLQEESYQDPPHHHGSVHSGVGYSAPRVIPVQADLERAAELLNAGQRVAMLVGAGCLGAGREVLEVAELLGAGVAKALLGKAVCPDDAPGVTGAIGLLGTKPSGSLMQRCDTLLMVGTCFPYSEFLPKPGQARGVQIDLDGRNLGMRYPCELNLVGDAKQTLTALVPLLQRKSNRSFREGLQSEVRDWNALLRARAMQDAEPINPQRVFTELSSRLPDKVILSSDSGSTANWFARDLHLREGMLASLSGNLATMGPGVPYAIAAKMAYPERPVIALVGDGAMQMNGLNGLITLSKYWEEWEDPRLVVLVLANRDLNQVTWEMRAMSGDPKLEASQTLPEVAYARFAESLGLLGIRVDQPDAVGVAWDRALRADRPCVIEAVVDPEVPPLPPHITLEQARAFGSAVLKGDPASGHFIRQAIRETVQAHLPGAKKPE